LKPNIFFLVIDGLRADKFYGSNKSSITPNIDVLLKKGTYFNQSISSAPFTFGAVSSFLTSLYPFECLIKEKSIYKRDRKIKTYIEKLQGDGYHSYAILPEIMYYIGINEVFEHLQTYKRSSKIYNGLGEQIIKKLESEEMKEPWIFYLHIYDIQWITDYDSYANYENGENDSKNGKNRYERRLSLVDVWLGKIFERINLDKTLIVLTSDHGHELGDYDEELDEYAISLQKMRLKYYDKGKIFRICNQISSKFPRVLSPLKAKMAKTYVSYRDKKIKNIKNIIPEIQKISKEGLSVYERRIRERAEIYTVGGFDERYRVPLLFVGPSIPSQKVIQQQVRSIDIFPTICEIINLEIMKDRRGRSLWPIINGRQQDELPICIESTVNSPLSSASEIIGIRTSDFKYFRDKSDSNKNVNLYDLKVDPLEEHNIAKQNHEIIERMELLLKQLETRKDFDYAISECDVDEVESKMIEQELKKLGYI